MSPAIRLGPMASPRDPRLDGLLAALSARLDCSPETAVYIGADVREEIGELADLLADAGLLLPAEPASALICDGCERNCVMPVQVAPATAAQPGRAFIVCDKRDDIGRVPVDLVRLRRWIFSLPVLADTPTNALKKSDTAESFWQSGTNSTPHSAATGMPKKRPPASRDLRSWYEQRVRDFKRTSKQPSREDDYQDANRQFEARVTHDMIARLRRELAPEWTEKGRRSTKSEKKKLEM
jgi:hypothetical protein